MAGSNFIWRHCKKQQIVFSDNLSILKKKPDIEAVHDLRVATKKLRSYFKLCARISGKKNWKEGITETEKLFSILGKYQDLQMNLQLLTVTEKEFKTTFGSIKKYLRASLPDAQKRMDTTLVEYPSEELANFITGLKKELLIYTDTELLEKIRTIFFSYLNQISKQIKDLRSEAHPVRKQLKDIYYWLAICPRNSIIPSSNLKPLDKILDRLGKWQDRRVLIIKIKHFRKEFLPGKTSEYSDYKDLEKELKKKNRTDLDDTGEQIEKWLNDISHR